ncbi:hypothetical protein ACOMHN_032227 [Nucella lapillus]
MVEVSNHDVCTVDVSNHDVCMVDVCSIVDVSSHGHVRRVDVSNHDICGHLSITSARISQRKVTTGGTAKDYQFSLFDAVCTLQQAWDEVTPMTISNCFVKAGFKHEKDAEACAEEHNHSKHETQEPILKRLFEEYNIPPEVYFTVDDGVATMGSASCPTTVPAASTSNAPETFTTDASDEEDNCGEEEKSFKQDCFGLCYKTTNLQFTLRLQ